MVLLLPTCLVASKTSLTSFKGKGNVLSPRRKKTHSKLCSEDNLIKGLFAVVSAGPDALPGALNRRSRYVPRPKRQREKQLLGTQWAIMWREIPDTSCGFFWRAMMNPSDLTSTCPLTDLLAVSPVVSPVVSPTAESQRRLSRCQAGNHRARMCLET